MKAILVIDMPKDCYGCDFCLGGSSLMYLCERTGKEFEFINGERKDFCPLKPMPQKRKEPSDELKNNNSSIYYSDCRFVDGWNACIDEITGGNE